jgi:hypothetical protein
MSQRHLSQDLRSQDLLRQDLLRQDLLSQEQRIAELRLGRPSRRSLATEPEKRRSILPMVIAAFVVVGLAAYLLNGRGGPTASGWQNLHRPVVPTHITPDGVPGRPGI